MGGHTANLPGTINNYFDNEGDEALTNFPFYNGGTHHWGIAGVLETAGNVTISLKIVPTIPCTEFGFGKERTSCETELRS